MVRHSFMDENNTAHDQSLGKKLIEKTDTKNWLNIEAAIKWTITLLCVIIKQKNFKILECPPQLSKRFN